MSRFGQRLKQRLTQLALMPLSSIGRQPLARARALTGWLAHPMRWLMRRRAGIVQRNLELCFPDMNRAERQTIQKQHFDELAKSIGEIAFAWQHPHKLDHTVGQVTGLEHLEKAAQQKIGVILLTGHTCNIELAGRLLCEAVETNGVYRPLRNQALEQYQNAGRLRYAKAMLKRDNVRGMVRVLRAGGVLWTAMDQDFGPKRSIFAPFFGLPTATARGLLDLTRLGQAQVLPVYPFKDEQSGQIRVEISPAFESFPSDDPVADLTQYNAFLERCIRRQPSEYWWLHRRFKTTPEGVKPRYR